MKLCYIRSVLAFSLALVSPLSIAQDFKLAMSGAPTSIDPHFYNGLVNVMTANHMYEQLVGVDSANKLVPKLAVSWKMIDKLTWEFKLRQGVKFHDGSPFTAADVAYSYERAKTIVSPGSFYGSTAMIASTTIVDPHTIRFTMAAPFPDLLVNLAGVMILSQKASQGVKSDAFNSGKGAVGTGPFKFVRFQRDNQLELARHDASRAGAPTASSCASPTCSCRFRRFSSR